MIAYLTLMLAAISAQQAEVQKPVLEPVCKEEQIAQNQEKCNISIEIRPLPSSMGGEATNVLKGKEQYPIPQGNPGAWISTDDYPASALRKNAEGISAFRLKIDTKGSVKSCEIVGSSGDVDLDFATCRLVAERAKFNPALDENGNFSEGYYSSRVRWQLPNVSKIPEPNDMTVTFVVEKDGSVSSCKFNSPNRIMKNPDPCIAMPSFMPPVNIDGKPVRKRVTAATVIRITDLTDDAN